MSDTVKAAIIGVAGLLIGILLTVLMEEYRAMRDKRRLRRSLASVLLTEVFARARLCCEAGSKWNLFQQTRNTHFSEALASIPPPPRALDALAPQIHVFEAATVSSIITFYGAVDAVRAIIEMSRPVGKGRDFRHPDTVKLADQFRRACFLALLAIRALEPLAKVKPKPNDAKDMARLKADLQKVAEGGVLAEPVSEAIQKMSDARKDGG